MLGRVTDAAGEAADEIVVVTRESLRARLVPAIPSGIRLIADRSRIRSPLVGLVAGAEALESESVAALACDLPFLRGALVRRLFRACRTADAAVPRWPNGLIEPLVAVYRREALAAAGRSALRAGGRSNQDLLDRIARVRWVPTDSLRVADPRLESFVNVNTPRDVARARRIASRRSAPRPRTR